MIDGTMYRFYRIKCHRTSKTYIGRTTRSLDMRLSKHISSANFYNAMLKINKSSFNGGAYALIYQTVRGVDYDIELIKELVLDSELESRIIEQIYLDEERLINVGNVANLRDAYSSKENSMRKNRKRENDKYKNDADHRERLKNNAKNYGETNKAKLAEKKKERIVCELCGENYTRSNKWFHTKSVKHISKLINPIQEIKCNTAITADTIQSNK